MLEQVARCGRRKQYQDMGRSEKMAPRLEQRHGAEIPSTGTEPNFLRGNLHPFFGHLRVFRPGAREPRQPLRNLPTTKYLAISKIAQSSTAPTVHDAQLRVKPVLQTPDIRELAAHTNQIPGPTADPATPASPAPGLGIATFGPKGKERRCKCSIDSPVHVWRRGR